MTPYPAVRRFAVLLVLVLGFLVAMRQLSTAAGPHTFPSEANVSIAAPHPFPAATRSDAVETRTSQEATTATTTVLTASLNPSYSGQSVSFTASVTSQGTGTPTGTVVFLAGATQLAQVALDANGQAIFATSTFTSGSYSITAQYGGDSNFGPSTGSLAQVVNTPPTPDSISVNPQMQTLFEGESSQQFTAMGNYNDGSSLDLTNSATWESSNPAVATIGSSGLATAIVAGNTGITASFHGVKSSPVTLGIKKPGAFVQFLGGGSSAMFLELGQAAQSSTITATPCVWTHSSDLNVVSRDNRSTAFPPHLPVDEEGDIWITWGPGTGTCAAPTGNFDIYAYSSLDSVLGVRCFFEAGGSGSAGCIQILSIGAGAPGENKLCNPSGPCVYGPDTPIPQTVINAVHSKHWFAAGTDILPEDAKFAILRMFAHCGETIWRQPFDQGLRQTYGLGYHGTIPGIGVPVLSHFSDNAFHPLDFNYSGNDPLNASAAVPSYTISPVGAKPILVAVSPAGGTGIGAATDILGSTLALFTEGTLGRSTDLLGPTAASPVTTLISEPLSGPYNVMEYSIANTNQFHMSQDDFNCNGNGGVYSNGMNLQSNDGNLPAFRVRAVGTSEMIGQLQAATTTDQRLGYFYWSAANAARFTAQNGKYLTVNGVDPLQDQYTDGVLPGADPAHPLSSVSFKWLNMGDYPLWSVLRIVSESPTPIGVTNLVSAAQQLNITQHNFIPLADLQVWHSHYYLPVTGDGVAALGSTIHTPSDLCRAPGALPELGGDLGGSNILKQVNNDFCSDFGYQNGLILRVN